MAAGRGIAIALLVLFASGSARATERAILVLGAAVRQNGQPTAGLARRLTLARQLAMKDPKAILVVSGGTRGGKWSAEGPTMARWLEKRGIAPARIRIEDRAANTAENADYSAPILLSEHVHRVTVVTERFHLARGLFHVRSALESTGAHVRIDGVGAPDGLSGKALEQRLKEEQAKIERDRAFRDGKTTSAAAQ